MLTESGETEVGQLLVEKGAGVLGAVRPYTPNGNNCGTRPLVRAGTAW